MYSRRRRGDKFSISGAATDKTHSRPPVLALNAARVSRPTALPPLGVSLGSFTFCPPDFFLGRRAGFCLLSVNDDRLDPLRLLQTLLGVRRAQARNFHCFLQVMRKEKKVYKSKRGGKGAYKECSFSIFFPITSEFSRYLHDARRKTGFRRIHGSKVRAEVFFEFA